MKTISVELPDFVDIEPNDLKIREFALGLESLDLFINKEPLTKSLIL